MIRYLTFSLVALAIVSCSDSNTVDPNSEATATEASRFDENFLHGDWTYSVTAPPDAGLETVEAGKFTFNRSGEFSARSEAKLIESESGEVVFSIEGPDKGTWSIESGKLVLIYTSMKIDEFKSSSPSITQEFVEEQIEAQLGKDEFYSVESIQPDELVLKEEEEQSIYRLTRSGG